MRLTELVKYFTMSKMNAPSSTDTVYRALGACISRGRRAAGMTQEELARRLNLTRTSIVNIEKGNQRLLVHTLLELAKIINVTSTQILMEIDWSTDSDVDIIPKNLEPKAENWIRNAVKSSKILKP